MAWNIYEYNSENYNELFKVDEEIERKKKIEDNNLATTLYEKPLTAIILKNFTR